MRRPSYLILHGYQASGPGHWQTWLAARLPFLFIAGRFYGPELLGRFAYAVIVIELAAQLATMGLKRGLAQQLSTTDQPHVCVVWDGLLAG